MTSTRTGLDVALENAPAVLREAQIGLLTNPSGIDRRLRSTIDRMHTHPDFQLASLFGPEHGVRGEAQAGAKIESGIDAATGLPTHSLYGATRTPTPEMLKPIDALVIDIQDIGVRYATYISSIAHVITACAEHDVNVVIFDRPNPLGGRRVAGNILDPAFSSFVGIHTIPTLHGLSPGEFGRLWASDTGAPEPTVVPMEGWDRSMDYDATGLPWVFPSPNLPTLDSVILYPMTCLIEGTTLSEGRGTTRPFEIIGAPWLDPERLALELNGLEIAGLAARPLYFTPMFSKHAGERCGGVQLYVTDRDAFDGVSAGVHLIALLNHLGGDRFDWTRPSGDRYFIDLLTGTDQFRRDLDAGSDGSDLIAQWHGEAERAKGRLDAVRIYR